LKEAEVWRVLFLFNRVQVNNNINFNHNSQNALYIAFSHIRGGVFMKPNGSEDEQIKFSSDHRAIMWISTKGLWKDDEKVVLEIIKEKIEESKTIFYGFCFGRYDLIVEFGEGSAKVASNIVCDLQDKIVEALKTEKPNITDPICSSLTICNKIGDNDTVKKCSIRTYTFLRPKADGVKLEDVIDKLKPEMELFWNASSYTFLLCINGDKFSEMFSKILGFRKATEQYFSESCTYIGLAWDIKEEEPVEEGIKALTFVKLKAGYGDLELEPEESKIWKMDKRLGWSDISLEIRMPTLRRIKEQILELRKQHEEIANTSTLILPKEGGENEQES